MSLGALPVLGQVMSATRGATDAFSGVQRHVNNSVCVSAVWFILVLAMTDLISPSPFGLLFYICS